MNTASTTSTKHNYARRILGGEFGHDSRNLFILRHLRKIYRTTLVAIPALLVSSFFAISLAPAAAAPPLLLANELGPDVDPTKYLVSEKFDGVRALWDGASLRFRSGRPVHAPAWFIAKLPANRPLDGELWLGRGRFDALSGIVRKAEPQDADWRQIKYLIFELPDAPGTFAERAQKIREVVAQGQWPQLIAVEQFHVADRAALKRKLDQIVRAGGEGLMLHLADAPYVTGRSDVLLKLKPLQDTEAVVIEQVPGKGKYQGMLGALRVQTPDGKKFLIGTGFTDQVRRRPPPIGATITYTYRGLSKTGLPRFASYLRVREDF
jgi:DNA ligase